MDDPKQTRMIQTRNGIARIPRNEEGISMREYFQNTELPENLERARVFSSASGPILAAPDPVAWTEMQDKQVHEYSNKLKAQIDEKGYYAKSLDVFAGKLSADTGYTKEEMKAQIVARFEADHDRDPFDYLQSVREAQGLPVRERGATQELQEPEL